MMCISAHVCSGLASGILPYWGREPSFAYYLCLQVGEVKSSAFTKAFFTLYLGSDPVSKEGKSSITAGLAELATPSAKTDAQ